MAEGIARGRAAESKRSSDAQSPGREGVVSAGINAFRARGYHGTSVRDLARSQNVSVAALYHWFPSKYELLVEIMLSAMDDIIADVKRAIDEAPPTPAARLAAAIRTQVLFHTTRQAEAFVSNSELRSLEPKELRQVLRRRDKLEGIFGELIEQGQADGSFPIDDADEVRRSIIAMTIAVHNWYRPRQELSPEQIADRYVTLALRLLRAEQLA
jgi:AcrR family transcriptional regulator